MGYLSGTEEAGVFNLAAAMQDLKARGGPGPIRQLFYLFRLFLRRVRVRPEEYYTYAIWRKDRGRAFLRDFLPNSGTRAFNMTLAMPGRGPSTDGIVDKLATEAILTARGLAVTRTLAAYMPGQAALPPIPGLQVLRSVDDVAAFLGDPANLPCFGKPRADSFARGAAVFDGFVDLGNLRFLDGRTAPIDRLVAEIVQDWSNGYLFQRFYQCADGLRQHVGAAMASVRIVTLLTDRGVEPWYGVIRLPAKSAMHDGDAKDSRIWGLIDLASGQIIKLRYLRDALTPDVTHGNDHGLTFLGTTLPHWPEAMDLCLRAHESFPGHGIIGWDVFLTDEGALLNEANASPGHLYQAAAQRPLLNPDLRPAYERALAHARAHGGGKPTS